MWQRKLLRNRRLPLPVVQSLLSSFGTQKEPPLYSAQYLTYPLLPINIFILRIIVVMAGITSARPTDQYLHFLPAFYR